MRESKRKKQRTTSIDFLAAGTIYMYVVVFLNKYKKIRTLKNNF